MIVPNILPFIVFLILLLINKHKVKKWLCMSNLIFAIYTASAGAFYILSKTPYYHWYKCSLLVLVLVVIIIYLMVLPLSNFEKHYNSDNKLYFTEIPQKKLNVVVNILIIFGFYSIIFFSQYLAQVFVNGAVATRSEDGGFLFEASVLSKIAVYGSCLSPIALFFYFYNKSVNVLSKTKSRLLLVASTANIIHTLNVAGRDGIVSWGLCFFALFILFYDSLTSASKKSLVRIIIIAGILSLPLLFMISEERFSETSAGTEYSMLCYFGQSWNNLTDNYIAYEKTGINNINPFGNFDLLTTLFPFLNSINSGFAYDADSLRALGFHPKQFAFFIGSFIPHYSNHIIFTIIIIICILIYRNNLRGHQDSRVDVGKMLTAFSWYMIPIVGVFYFLYGTIGGNAYLLTPFIIRWYLKK